MSGGQNGWPPGGGGPNPWGAQPPAAPGFPQPQGPWGAPQPGGQAWPPTQAQPAFGTAPTAPAGFGQQLGGAPPAPAAAGPEEVAEVELPWPMNTVPNACACCGAAADAQMNAQATAQMGRTTQTRTVSIPYCRRCVDHVKAGKTRGLSLGLLALLVALPFPLLVMVAWDYAPWFVSIPSSVAVALIALVVLETVWKARPVAREQGCCAGDQPAFWMQGFAFNGPSVKFRGVNPRWVQQIAGTYGAQPRPMGRRSPSRGRWIAAPLVALIAAVPTWFAMHGHVYVDNPSSETLTFDIDDGCEALTLAPGAHGDLWLPSGNTRIAVKRGAQAVETIRGEVGHWSTHAVTPLGTACYAEIQAAYGSARLAGAGYRDVPQGQRWHDLSGVQHVFEPFPRSVSVGRGQSGATRRRFTRVVCETGAPI